MHLQYTTLNYLEMEIPKKSIMKYFRVQWISDFLKYAKFHLTPFHPEIQNYIMQQQQQQQNSPR